MPQNDYVFVPLSFEYLMSALFGKDNYHGYVGEVSKSIWKKDLKKIVKYIKKSIELNVDADQCHKNRLISLCNELESKLSDANSTEQMSVIVIEKLIKLVFHFLGNMPDHWRGRSPYADRFWELDGHRRLTYTQTDEQKAYLIIYLVDIRKDYTLKIKGFNNLHAVFYRKFKSKAHHFIVWFKKMYPEIYCEIF